ncbi:MAG: amidohydrolase family protein [Thermoleophilia bacterium]|nr:amidohydrolase family protein [Thermoleophilia bacterium]
MIVSADWVLPIEGEPIADGAVVVEDGRIAAVGPAAELGEGERFEDSVVVPGFVNAHSHLEYAVYAGFGDGLDFAEWILVHIERKARIGWEEHVANARAGAAECLRSGITTVGDASFSGAAAVACAELGLRALVYLEVFGGPEQLATRFEPARKRITPFLSDRVRLGISPHAPYSVTPELYAACLELGLPVATHLAESEDEHRWLTSGTGPWERFADALPPPLGTTGIRHLAARGTLSPRVTAAHCVTVDDDELALLAASDVAVAHCPRSNALLGCGVAPLAALRGAGLRVGLGTDSPASAVSFDMFDELRAAVLGERARARRADALTGAEALELATLGSARALGLDGEVGSLIPGKRADLTVVSLAGSTWLPWEDAATAVVLGGSPDRVRLTLVDGEARYRHGDTQWHALTAAARDARRRLLAPAASTPR